MLRDSMLQLYRGALSPDLTKGRGTDAATRSRKDLLYE